MNKQNKIIGQHYQFIGQKSAKSSESFGDSDDFIIPSYGIGLQCPTFVTNNISKTKHIMKKDYYFPHEIRTRNDEAVMELIECEGASGYGIYWALLEYLRTQEGYVGKMVAVKAIARQMRTKPYKVDSVLRNYDLFIVTEKTFRSAKLETVMKPLDDKRKAMEARCSHSAQAMSKRCKSSAAATSEQNLDKPLEINGGSSEKASLIKKNKVNKNQKEDTSSPISSSSPATEAEVGEKVLSKSFVPAWEKYVDELQKDEQWMELAAMRSGMKQQFFTLFPRIVESFKRHVRSLGNEGSILSPSDAKHYFFFFLNPSSPTYKNLILELQKPIDKGRYRYEDRDPATGRRSYCGIPIPDDAPPRPNAQAVWSGNEWIY